MAVFEYHAIDRSSKKRVKGLIDADSAAAARRKLREQALSPTQIKESFGGGGAAGGGDEDRNFDISRVSTRDLGMMTRQLAVLLNAGMPLVEALTALLDQTSKSKLRKALFDVRDRVREGVSLADGMEAHPRIFSMLFVNMVRAGESSGALESVLYRLADILEHQAKMRAKIMGTMAYPAFMALFAIAIISFLVVVIVPRITQLFERQDQELPRLTEMLIASTGFIRGYWWLLIGSVLVGFWGWRMYVARPEGRLRWDAFKLRVPMFGSLYLKLICGRFARTLGTMLESGLTITKALDVVTTILQNRYVEKAMDDVKQGVRRGKDLAVPMKQTGIFPPLLLYMVELGQRSGELEKMLLKVADTYDDDVQVTVDAMVSLLEPVIIIIMGLFVGLLVLSILLPILNMSTNIG
jgi:general secretion pathway protein F